MILGQSAGVAAALAAKEGVAVQNLAYPKLRKRLLAQGQVLELPTLPELPSEPVGKASIPVDSIPGIVLDDEAAELKGDWQVSTNFKPHIGRGYRHDDKRGDGKSQAVFRFKADKSGEYELRMAYSAHETRAKKVPVVILSGEREQTLHVDQTVPLPAGQAFRSIGKCQLEGGVESTITVSNSETEGFVILDALQLTPTKP
jgi:hypothetical protein